MPKTTRSPLLRYGAAVAGVVLAALVRWLLDPALGDQLPFFTFFIAVLFTAWYGGFGPSLVAVLLGALAGTYLFVSPRGGLAVHEGQVKLVLSLYLVAGAVFAVFSEALQAARRRAEASAEEAARNRESLSLSEARYRQIVETAHEGIWVLDGEDRTTFANRRMAEILRCSVEEMIGRSAFDFVFPEDRPEGERLVDQRRQGVREELDLRYRRKDGAEVWLHVSASPVFDGEGRFAGSMGLFTDITKRRRAEQEVREQADVLSGILAATVDHIYVVGRDGRYRHVSAGGARVLGFEPHDLTGKGWRELGLSADLMEQFDAHRDRALQSGQPSREEVVFRTPQSGERHFEYVVAPIAGEGGRAEAVVVVSRDVSERRAAEAALRQTKGLLDAVVDYAPACIFAKDRQGRYLLANRSLAQLVGRGKEEFPGRTDYDFFPPEVAEEFGKDDAAIIASGQPRTYEESFPQGGVNRTYLTVKFPLRDERGDAYAACAVATEITDLKRVQEALRATAERLNLALAAARLGDWGWDAATDIVTFSDRAAEIFGIPPGPHMTWTAMQGLLHEEDRNDTRIKVETAVAGRTRYEAEYRVSREDGTQVWVAASGRGYYAPSGQPLGMYGVVGDITARKEADAALLESEERFRASVGQAAVGVALVGPDHRTLFVNRGLCEMLGYAEGELLASSFADVTHPDDLNLDYAQMARLVSGEATSCRYEKRYRHKDGPVVWADLSVAAVRGARGELKYVVGVVVDITARKRAEQNTRFLADASATLAGLVDYESTLQKVARLAVPHFADWATVDMLDEGGALRRLAVAHVDPAKVELAHELYRRYPPDTAAPQGVWNIVRTGKSEIIAEIPDELLAATAKDANLLRIMRELGLKSYMGVPLSVRGRALGVVTFIAAESGRRYDADDFAVAEDLAHRAAVAIENARLYQEVREADRRKDEFLAILGHELRNPLAPISNALQVLKMPGANGEVAAHAREMMERQVQHMVRLVDDLLDVSRIVRGKVELRKEPLELATVVARAVETAQPLMEADGHELTVALPPEPLRVSGDLVRLAQVVGNLLNNAARYTERGGKIRVEAERVGDRAVVRVRDTGIGIAADALPKIWEMFVQADRRMKGSHGGMGIGLALVKGLVELHGGTVEAKSDGPGRGSEFAVTLPLLPPQQQEGPGRVAGRSPYAVSRRVLVVDDNVDAAESLAMLLRLGGHEARVAYDGPSALKLAGAEPPEVAFLDIGMPGMDGYELARRFREDGSLRGVLLVALTGWGQEEDRRRSHEAGFDYHMVKPVDPQALMKLLAELHAAARIRHG